MRSAWWMIALAGCGGGLCGRSAVESALADAARGDRVVLGACTVEGPLVVPGGGTAAGVQGTVVEGTVTMEMDAVLADLTVRVDRGSEVEARAVSHILI